MSPLWGMALAPARGPFLFAKPDRNLRPSKFWPEVGLRIDAATLFVPLIVDSGLRATSSHSFSFSFASGTLPNRLTPGFLLQLLLLPGKRETGLERVPRRQCGSSNLLAQNKTQVL